MDWFQGPLTDVWGIPSFWVQRIAKVVQFLSGSIIVLDVIGKDRIEEWANSVRDRLAIMATAQPLRSMAKDLWETVKAFVLYIFSWPKTKKEAERLDSLVSTKYDQLAWKIWLPLSVINAVVFSIVNYTLNWSVLWKVPLTLGVSLLVSWIFIYLVLFNAALIAIVVIVRPLEWIFDVLATIIVNLLKRAKLSQVATIISFFLLIFGVIFELLVT